MQDTSMNPPSDVRAGPMHPDPYFYYRGLAADRPLFRDDEHGFWVAAGAAAVKAVLTSDICHTSPAAKLPAEAASGPLGQIFGRLVRLRDDEAGCRLKDAMITTLRDVDLRQAALLAQTCAANLGAELEPQRGGDHLTRFMFALPAAVMAALLGFAESDREAIEAGLKDYGQAAAALVSGVPALTEGLIARGHAGSGTLIALTSALVAKNKSQETLLAAWVANARQAGCDDADIIANAIGLLIQPYVAVASMIGLTLLALARRSDLRAAVAADRKALRRLVGEVLRCDPTAQRTLRFVARDGIVAGQQMRKGDKIIVLFAAASLDHTLNGDVPRFDIFGKEHKSFGFGAGQHACPGDKLAPLITEIGVAHLLACGVALETLEAKLAYAASAHIRTPLFHN